MGDCHIRVLVAGEVLSRDSNEKQLADRWKVVDLTHSSDTTVKEVIDGLLLVVSSIPFEAISLWDCTLHPPRDITIWYTVQFPEVKGPKSKTLFDAGWYPSARWQVVRRGHSPVSTEMQQDVDIQFNDQQQQNQTLLREGDQQAQSGDKAPQPSEIMNSVAARFVGESQPDGKLDAARLERHRLKRARAAMEQERNRKIEEQIQRLESTKGGKKNKSVSDKVRKMLIKSRCKGKKSIKQQDRVFFHIVLVNDYDVESSSPKEDYLYFSHQDTVARVCNVVAGDRSRDTGVVAELLARVDVADQDEDAAAAAATSIGYRRLPLTMRLNEAIEQGFLQDVARVVLRFHNGDTPTPTVMDTTTGNSHDQSDEPKHGRSENQPANVKDLSLSNADGDGDLLSRRARIRLEELLRTDKGSKPSSSKTTKTSAKVRSMLMKGKAKGDKKRIPKMEDRFFMEVVVASDDGNNASLVDSKFVFMGRNDRVERLIQDHTTAHEAADVVDVFFMPENSSCLNEEADGPQKIDKSITFREAEEQGRLAMYERVVVYIRATMQ